MRPDDFRKQYDLQFRWEEGRLVYRHKRRGVPVEVSPAERERALERFEKLKTRIVNWWFGATFFIVSAFIAVMPKSFQSGPYLVAIMAASGVSLGLLLEWAWNEPTRAWRSRRPIGEPLGGAGALVMTIEKVRWRQLVVGIVGPPILALPWVGSHHTETMRHYQAPVLAMLAGLFLLGLLFALIKIALHERERLRRRHRQVLAETRSLFDEDR